MTRIFENVRIDPALREHIVLSSKEVADLYAEAATKSDPDTWLADALNERGRAKKTAIEKDNAERMGQDKAFFLALDRWPDTLCRVKEQPWIKANGRRYGKIYAEDVKASIWVVFPDDEEMERFESLDELVKVWSVD